MERWHITSQHQQAMQAREYCCFYSWQQPEQLHQIYKSSEMSKVTATVLCEYLVTFDAHKENDMLVNVPITYVDQIVPSPLNMYQYKECTGS